LKKVDRKQQNHVLMKHAVQNPLHKINSRLK